MNGTDAIAALKKKFRVTTDKDLAEALGLSTQAIQNWKNRPNITATQFADLTYRASRQATVRFRANILRPLVEFFRIKQTESASSFNKLLFDSNDKNGKKHPFLSGLRQELEKERGVYLFFDSRGQAIYAGKARRQSLWKEMNSTLNRHRGYLQTIKRVNHPGRKQNYQTSDEKARQIVDSTVPLWDIASYFSAYQVADELIEDIEALLVRSFANSLLNKRMERFARHRYPIL